MVDVNKSFIHFIQKESSWRTNIKSILSTENKKFFLVKECRAESIGEHPFFHTGRYEFLGIVEDDKTHFIRKSAVDGNKGNVPLNAQEKNKKYIVESNVNYLSFEKIHEIVSSGKTNNIYCEIEYEYEAIKYSLISKCEYINYNTEKYFLECCMYRCIAKFRQIKNCRFKRNFITICLLILTNIDI